MGYRYTLIRIVKTVVRAPEHKSYMSVLITFMSIETPERTSTVLVPNFSSFVIDCDDDLLGHQPAECVWQTPSAAARPAPF